MNQLSYTQKLNLAVAAPEMLKALEQISEIDPACEECRVRNKHGACDCIGCIARRAISKAKGEL